MRSISGCLGLFGWAALWAVACSGSAGDLFSPGAGAGGTAGFGGRGGRGGIGGRSGAGIGGEAGGLDGGVDGGGAAGADGGGACADACDDGNDCTLDVCDGEECRHPLAEVGAPCGSGTDGDCSSPDSCDGSGVCLSNDAPDGAECSQGSCTLGECIEGQPVGCPAAVVTALPFETEWRTVGGVDLYGGNCNADDVPDFAVVFTAPSDGTYRFEAAGLEGTDDPESGGDASELADSVLTVAAGACAGPGAPLLDCSDDIGGGNLDSRIDLPLDEGDTVTVYAGEFGELLPGGGSGTLSIRRLED